MIRRYGSAVLIALAACAAPATAATPPDNGGWEFRLTPYVWGADTYGSARIAPLPRTTLHQSFSDTLSHLDGAGMFVLEARRGDWGLLGDVTHVSTSEDVGYAPLGASGRFSTRMTTAALLASYRAIDEGHFSLAVLVGARHWDLRATGTLDTPLPARARLGKRWTDAQLGVNLAWQPGGRHRLSLVALGAVADEATVDATALYSYAFSHAFSARIGYRYSTLRTRGSAHDLDLSMAGPVIGLGMTF